jgi:hypothetical protein
MTSLNCAYVAETFGIQAKGYAPARPFSAAPNYVEANPAPKYRALAPHFVLQQTECSCSVASTTVILNAALGQRRRKTWTQADVLASDTTGAWARATDDSPDCTGVDLEQLALLTMRSFYAAGLKSVSVDVHHIFADTPELRDVLRYQLSLSEKEAGDYYVVLNFHQKTVLGAGDDVGHMSVAAAFDKRKDRVLIYDVDNRGFEPYWVSLDLLMAGMHTQDDETREPRGYLMVRLNR